MRYPIVGRGIDIIQQRGSSVFGRGAIQVEAKQFRQEELDARRIGEAVPPPEDLARLVISSFENIELCKFQCRSSDVCRGDRVERIVYEGGFPGCFGITARLALRKFWPSRKRTSPLAGHQTGTSCNCVAEFRKSPFAAKTRLRRIRA